MSVLFGFVRAGVAQLARAVPCQGTGHEFEPRYPLHFPPGLASQNPKIRILNTQDLRITGDRFLLL